MTSLDAIRADTRFDAMGVILCELQKLTWPNVAWLIRRLAQVDRPKAYREWTDERKHSELVE